MCKTFGIKFLFARAIDGISDSIQKSTVNEEHVT